MKRLSWGLLVPFALLISGCFEITEEIFLNRDGSGKYVYTLDMSALMDESVRGMLEGMMDSTQQQTGPLEVDTAIYFKDYSAEELSAISQPEIMKRGYMKVLMSDSQEKMVMEFGLDFTNPSEIDYFIANLDQLTQNGEGMMGNQGFASDMMLSGQSIFSLKGKTFSREIKPADETEPMSQEDLDMAAMMFESGIYRVIYHMPGKVKKSSIPGAVINGNDVSVEVGLLEIIKKEAQMDGNIKYK